jgi:hypothetical protein
MLLQCYVLNDNFDCKYRQVLLALPFFPFLSQLGGKKPWDII